MTWTRPSSADWCGGRRRRRPGGRVHSMGHAAEILKGRQGQLMYSILRVALRSLEVRRRPGWPPRPLILSAFQSAAPAGHASPEGPAPLRSSAASTWRRRRFCLQRGFRRRGRGAGDAALRCAARAFLCGKRKYLAGPRRPSRQQFISFFIH